MSAQGLNARGRRSAWRLLGTVEHLEPVQSWLQEAESRTGRAPADAATEGPLDNAWARAFPRFSACTAWLVLVALLVGVLLHAAPVEYRTRVGEQRQIQLPDGSTAELNTDTAIVLRYSKTQRLVELRRGEALFSVKHDSTRPFVVSASGTLIWDVGTVFNVELRPTRVTVSVLQGVVRVATDAPAGIALRPQSGRAGLGIADGRTGTVLTKGKSLEFLRTNDEIVQKPADLQRIEAWRSGLLEFTDTPLSQAVAEFNRYTPTPLVIRAPRITGVRVTGVFHIGDTASFLFALHKMLGVAATVSGNRIILRLPHGYVR